MEGWKEWEKGGKRDQKVREARQVLLKIPILVAKLLALHKKEEEEENERKEKKRTRQGQQGVTAHFLNFLSSQYFIDEKIKNEQEERKEVRKEVSK